MPMRATVCDTVSGGTIEDDRTYPREHHAVSRYFRQSLCPVLAHLLLWGLATIRGDAPPDA